MQGSVLRLSNVHLHMWVHPGASCSSFSLLACDVSSSQVEVDRLMELHRGLFWQLRRHRVHDFVSNDVRGISLSFFPVKLEKPMFENSLWIKAQFAAFKTTKIIATTFIFFTPSVCVKDFSLCNLFFSLPRAIFLDYWFLSVMSLNNSGFLCVFFPMSSRMF